MKTFKTRNGMTMSDTTPLFWEQQHTYADNTGPIFYSIYVSTAFMDGHLCVYDPDKQIVSISFARHSSDDPSMKFEVNSIEEAGELVIKFAKGMNCLRDLESSVYGTKK